MSTVRRIYVEKKPEYAVHAKELKRFTDKVVVCFDGDGAGIKATLRSLEILVSAGLNVYVASLPAGVDPDEFVLKYGKAEYDKLITNARYWVEYLIYYNLSKYNISKSEEKNKFIRECLGIINTLNSAAEKDIYLAKIRDITNISISVLKEDLKNFGTDETIDKIDSPKANSEPNLRENAYVKADKFVIAALLYKKPYAKLQPEIKTNLKNNDYVKIYEYIEEQLSIGNVPKVSSVFDMFNVDDNSDVYDVVNFEFNPMEDNEKYYNDCVSTLASFGLLMQQEELTKRLKETKDNNERLQLAKELQALIMKRKGQN